MQLSLWKAIFILDLHRLHRENFKDCLLLMINCKVQKEANCCQGSGRDPRSMILGRRAARGHDGSIWVYLPPPMEKPVWNWLSCWTSCQNRDQGILNARNYSLLYLETREGWTVRIKGIYTSTISTPSYINLPALSFTVWRKGKGTFSGDNDVTQSLS